MNAQSVTPQSFKVEIIGGSLNLVNLMDQFAEAGGSPQLQTHLIPHNYTAALKPRIDAEVCWERLCRV